MTKRDLRTGMVVENKYGDRYVVMDDIISRLESYDVLSNYNDDLTNNVVNGLTIVKVYGGRDTSLDHMLENPGELIWERTTYYNGKVVCVDNSYNANSLTVGKIYEFKDGFLRDNNGNKRPYLIDGVKSLEEFHKCGILARFIEVVE